MITFDVIQIRFYALNPKNHLFTCKTQLSLPTYFNCGLKFGQKWQTPGVIFQVNHAYLPCIPVPQSPLLKFSQYLTFLICLFTLFHHEFLSNLKYNELCGYIYIYIGSGSNVNPSFIVNVRTTESAPHDNIQTKYVM